jgi:type I restriction enzyme, S subunit
MLKDWQLLELQEVSKVVDSLHRTPAFTNSGYPMVRAADVKGGFLDLTETELVSEEEFLDFTRNHKPLQGDIVLSRVGSYFNFSYNKNDKEFCIGQNTSIIVPIIDSRFLYYSLISPFVQEQIERSLVGTSQKTLSLKYIRELKIPTPSPNKQRAIGEVLGALDDKIELNRRMNRTLESMAQAVFRQWFVESEEVGGWEIGKLGDLVTLISERVDATPEKDNEKYIALDDMPSKSIDLSQYRLGSEVNSSITRFRRGDILFGSMRPYFHKVGIAPFDGITRITTFTLRPNQDVFRAFALYWFFSHEVIDFSSTASVGTTIPYVRWETLGTYEIPIPPHSLMERFTDIFQPLWLEIVANGKESRTLASLRDTLLPKLMRGEVRVKDV